MTKTDTLFAWADANAAIVSITYRPLAPAAASFLAVIEPQNGPSVSANADDPEDASQLVIDLIGAEPS